MPDRPDEAARRAYWTEQMDLAAELMVSICRYPVAECGEAMVALPEAAAAEGVEVIFPRTELVPDHRRLFYLRGGLVEPFLAAAADMNRKGWVLRLEDGFRTRSMQKGLVRKQGVFDTILKRLLWERRGQLPEADFVARRVAVLVAESPRHGTHMAGSAIDISVVRAADGKEVQRGGPYLEFSELTPMDSPFVTAQARRNRAEITALMARHAFMAYPYEFWHYCQGDVIAEFVSGSGRPARYGPVDWDPATGEIRPIDRPELPLNSMAEIRMEIERAMARLGDAHPT